MAVERRDPLPVGRYWFYVLEDELGDWDEWVREHSTTVQVMVTERKATLPSHSPAVMVTRPDLSIIMDGAGSWVLFNVLAPTPWVGFGYPTIVTDMSIRRSSHVEQAPDPVPDDQFAGDLWREAKSLVLLGAGVYLGGILLKKALES